MVNMRRSLAMLMSVAIILALTACGTKKQVEDDGLVWGDPPEETPGIAVDNSYMTFYYPGEWEGKVEEIREEDGENVTVTFQTDISGKKVVLFSVNLGPGVFDGYLLGQLNDPQAGTINVYSVMNEVASVDWSEEEYNEICSLQERVNDIIVQFYEDERFVSSR